MRTTLDIDDDVLALARARAKERGVSLGRAVSELVRKSFSVERGNSSSGFPVFHAPPGAPVVTSDLVARYRDDPDGD